MGSPRLTNTGFIRWLECRSYREQRELYEAAKVIQQAYRQYKARITTQRQNEAERNAAIVIQSYYRRYKQYCYFKKLHKAAVLIQKHYRMHKALQKQKKAGESNYANDNLQLQDVHADVAPLWKEHQAAVTIQHAYRGHYQRKRQAAARKIQRFMRQSRQKLRKIPESSGAVCNAVTPLTVAVHGPNGKQLAVPICKSEEWKSRGILLLNKSKRYHFYRLHNCKEMKIIRVYNSSSSNNNVAEMNEDYKTRKRKILGAEWVMAPEEFPLQGSEEVLEGQ